MSVFSPSVTSLTNPYKFYVYRNAAWTSGTNAFAKVAFDTRVFDTNSNFDITTNNRFTAPVAGFYHFDSTVTASVATTAIFTIALYKNSSVILQGNSEVTGTSAQNDSATVSGTLQLAVNDFIEVFFYGSGGAGVVGAPYTWFQGSLSSLS